MLSRKPNHEFTMLTDEERHALGEALQVTSFGMIVRRIQPIACWGNSDGHLAMAIEQRVTPLGNFVPYMVLFTDPGCRNCGGEHMEKVESVPICLN